ARWGRHPPGGRSRAWCDRSCGSPSEVVSTGSVCRTGGVEDVDDEDQGLAGELALVTVGLGRGDHEHQLRADGGVDQALVPAGDDLALTEHEAEGRTALPGGVELAAVGPLPARVLHGEVVALAGGVASAHDELLDHRLRR